MDSVERLKATATNLEGLQTSYQANLDSPKARELTLKRKEQEGRATLAGMTANISAAEDKLRTINEAIASKSQELENATNDLFSQYLSRCQEEQQTTKELNMAVTDG